MEQGSRQLSGGSSFRPAVVLPVTCSVQKRLPLDMSVAIPTQSKPVRVGTNQPLRSAFTPRYPTLTSSVAAVHLIGPRSVYVPQAPAAHTLGAIRSFKTNGSSTANRLGYFQRTASGSYEQVRFAVRHYFFLDDDSSRPSAQVQYFAVIEELPVISEALNEHNNLLFSSSAE
ncbi:hypothetical protein M514_06902 [Trichuris suis]|uniref:Uncharacterized protein n=1 Tax=Trichuris suis TaxID=68888 RepID=A0A085NLM4_9BILA|nr:hypothetical protein M514_06902 [Trichuris suis]